MPGTSEYATLDATEHMVADKAAEEVEVMTCGGREDSTPSNLAEEVPEIRDESGIVERVRILFSFASPVIVSFFLSFCGNFINLIFCGHFVPSKAGPTAAQVFAGVSLATMYTNVTFLSIIAAAGTPFRPCILSRLSAPVFDFIRYLWGLPCTLRSV